MKFGIYISMYLDIWVDPEYQGHRSMVKVSGSKKIENLVQLLRTIFSLLVYDQAALAPMINLLADFSCTSYI